MITLTGSAFAVKGEEKYITVASTTSTEQSGFFGWILPIFKKHTGIDVRIVALGTGQALDMAKRGDADVVFVHDRMAEENFVAAGFGEERFNVMYNDFVLVGPNGGTGEVQIKLDILSALRKIESSKALFITRGDKSGTHAAELRYWKASGVNIDTEKGKWYKECGCGMGQALNMAASINAYTLSDRATWVSFKNRGSLGIRVEGDSRLFNQYGVILVNQKLYPHIKKELGQQFIHWLLSPKGQKIISEYKINGEQLFFPNADGALKNDG